MSLRIVRRPARTSGTAPSLPPVQLVRPRALPDGSAGRMNLMMIVPLLGAGLSMTVMMLFRGSSFAAIGAIFMVVTIVGSLVMVFGQRGKAARQRRQQRARYLDHLEDQRERLSEEESELVAAARDVAPSSAALLGTTRSIERLWERRRGDADFLQLRLGVGQVRVRDVSLAGERDPLEENDDFMTAEGELLVQRFQQTYGVPLWLDARTPGAISVVGDREFTLLAARHVLAQAAALHSPEDVEIAVLSPRVDDWRWVTWLPHLADQAHASAQGPRRRFVTSSGDLHRVLADELSRRARAVHESRTTIGANRTVGFAPLLVVVDAHGSGHMGLTSPEPDVSLPELGVIMVHLLDDRRGEPERVRVRIVQDTEAPVDADRAVLIEKDRGPDAPAEVVTGLLDPFGAPQAEALARHLAPLRLSPDSLEHRDQRGPTSHLDALGVGDVRHLDLARQWAPREGRHFLRVPIGTDDHGDPVMLDLKEAAQLGHGPHGLCVGATGSGKSEALRTLVTGLALTHAPDDVALVLVDYKGGATFAPFADLPHVAGVITNLSDDASLIDRVRLSLTGEIERRQEVLKRAGNLTDITTYRAVRRAHPERELEPLPHMVVVIDEFTELLTARPDFIELFLQIGRIGRSIGVHLLLASQRIEGGQLRGLDTYLSYRLGLRTLSEAESRVVLDTPDAYRLPSLPGFGYLKVDTTVYTKFRAGYVSGDVPEPEVEAAVTRPDQPLVSVIRHGVLVDETVEAPREEQSAPRPPSLRPSVLDVVVDQLRDVPRTSSRVWLPPLPPSLTLDQIGAPVPDGLGAVPGWPRPLSLPVGLVDDPRRQTQNTWTLDLFRAGHVLLVGAPKTGTSTALRTIASAASLTHSPRWLSVYVLDLDGTGLASLADLPSVGGVGVRTDRDAVRRTCEELRQVLSEREQLMDAVGASTVDDLRRAQREGQIPAEAVLDEIVLLIDGWGQLAEEFEEIDDAVRALLRQGGQYGLHVIATAKRWGEVRAAQQTMFTTRVEFQLADAIDSSYGRVVAESMPRSTPGRSLVEPGLQMQWALPRVDGRADAQSAAVGLRDLAQRLVASTDERARPVRLLPRVVEPRQLGSGRGGRVALGLSESDLEPVDLDLIDVDRNLIVLGARGSGRTTTLRRIIAQLIEVHDGELAFAVVDPRKQLRDAVPEDMMAAYATSGLLAGQLAAAAAEELQGRVVSSVDAVDEDAGPRPHVVVIVDDYDIVSGGSGSPLQPLEPFISQGEEIGLTVVVARQVAGSSRGLYDPVLSLMRDCGGVCLLLSGDPAEGPIWNGVRAKPLPAGRGRLLRPGDEPLTVQVAWEGAEPAHEIGR